MRANGRIHAAALLGLGPLTSLNWASFQTCSNEVPETQLRVLESFLEI